MAQISFDQIEFANPANQSSNSNNVSFFTLKDDGDEAIVRFMHDSNQTFDIVTTHPVTVEGKYRKVNCIRDPKEPLDNCPLCKKGEKVQQSIFIHLIQYTKDEAGNIVAEAKVWERSLAYATKLNNFINEYGPLSDCVFKVRRNGAAGSRETSYDILYLNPAIYTPDLYVKRTDLFDNYKTLGGIVMDKSFDELTTFAMTGRFPVTAAQNANPAPAPAQTYTAPVYNGTQQQPYQQPPMQSPMPQGGGVPWENSQPQFGGDPSGLARPTRTY